MKLAKADYKNMKKAFEQGKEYTKTIEKNQPSSKIDFFYINRNLKIKPEKCLEMLRKGEMAHSVDPRSSLGTRSKS